MKFIGNVLATVVGLFIFCVLFFILIVLMGAIAGSGADRESIRDNSVIELDLSRISRDYAGKSNYKEFDYFEVKHNGLTDVINAIKEAKSDKRIKGISILNNVSDLGIAQTKALRDALVDFKKSKKFILSYANVYTQKDYYLNSVSDTIYINPIGNFEFKGLSAELMFFKGLQEKSGVKMEVIRHGKYKSAVEPFLEDRMSQANREQITSLLNSVWASIVSDISKTRNIPVDHLNKIADGLLARTPERAKAEKLVDKIAYEDDYHNAIRNALDVDQDKKYNRVMIDDYAEDVATTSTDFSAKDKIAVIYAQGDILSGEGSESYIGEGSMRRSLQEARKDKDVKAIVLRVDSPGGSALTSELIWREIELTKKTKPVVVSMGNVAASGGYYIACGADEIFAEENTITGSIGVFGLLPNLTTLSGKVGINTEQVNTHANAADYSPFLPLDDEFRGFVQEEVERIYSTFVARVAAGRQMSIAQVDSVGQGRIWSGSEALKIGLIDKIGGLDAAIASAAKKSKVKKYKIRNYPEYEKNFSDLLADMGIPFAKSRAAIIREEIGAENFRIYEKIKEMAGKKGIQAILPFELTIR